MSDFMKMCPLGVELFCADGQTDVTKLIVDFFSFANVLKNCSRKLKMKLLLFLSSKTGM